MLSFASNVGNGKVYMITSYFTHIAELNLIANSNLHEWILDSSSSFHEK